MLYTKETRKKRKKRMHTFLLSSLLIGNNTFNIENKYDFLAEDGELTVLIVSGYNLV